MRKIRTILLIGGYAQSLINFRGPIIKALRDAGFEVHAAAPELKSSQLVVEQLRCLGVRSHDAHIERAGLSPLQDLGGLWSLFRLMRRIKPDLVLCYTIKPVIYGTLAAWLARVPHRFALITGLGYAFTGEASGKRGLVQKLVRRLYHVALARAEVVFFQNPDDQALFYHFGLLSQHVPSAVVNGSGIDLSLFEMAPLPKGPVTFLLIARLLGDKGVREYVAAATKVHKRYPDVMFRLVGFVDDNPDSIRADEVDQWQRDGVIDYLGRLEDVRPAIENCSVYVLPSYREGTPRTVLEAMAMGRPIITTNVPGCRETVVEGDNGFMVPVKAVDELAKAMERFILQPELISRMGARSREIAVEKYDVGKVNAQMLKCMGIRAVVASEAPFEHRG